ncbi:MAG: recombination protein RecR [Myxococcales bacterium]|nr:recombination protein RecR [Myxococcales bacterium]
MSGARGDDRGAAPGSSDPIREAIRQLKRLPGIGEKSAARHVYHLLRSKPGTAREIGAALLALEEGVRTCSVCCDLTGTDPCGICASATRDDRMVLVVEHPQDIAAFERSGEYRGRYHVLHGALSPLDGITPDQLRVRELLQRLRDGQVQEVVLATDPDVEGDATALYLARLLAPSGVRVTRLAHGISVGTEIEYADALSLARALQNRVEVR